jgi:hypothetical protein
MYDLCMLAMDEIERKVAPTIAAMEAAAGSAGGVAVSTDAATEVAGTSKKVYSLDYLGEECVASVIVSPCPVSPSVFTVWCGAGGRVLTRRG